MISKRQTSNFKLQIGSRGFTLIELLIVIVIIGILSTVVIANFVGIRARARDAQRKSDLRQIQTALQLYYSDNGFYPINDEDLDCGDSFANDDDTVTYMREVPCDPIGENVSYHYNPRATNAGGTCSEAETGTICESYELYACLENGSDADTDENQGRDVIQDCDEEGETTRYSFTVINP